MGFLGDIANSGIGSDLLSLYNAQKEVESRDTLRQIQQQQLEEKKRADLANEEAKRQNTLKQSLDIQFNLYKEARASGNKMLAKAIWDKGISKHPLIPEDLRSVTFDVTQDEKGETVELITRKDSNGVEHSAWITRDPITGKETLKQVAPQREVNAQLVGHTPEGKPVSWDPRAKTQTVDGVPYTGVVKPKAEPVPSFTFVQTSEGIVPGNSKTGTLGQPTGVGKPLPSEQITTEQQIGTLKETLGKAKQLYKKEYVGPVAGRMAAAREQTIGLPEEQAMFNAEIAQLQNSLVYLMSGKQINEQEYNRLKRQLPDKNLPVSTFEARMKEFDRTVDSIIANRNKNMGGYGKKTGASGQWEIVR